MNSTTVRAKTRQPSQMDLARHEARHCLVAHQYAPHGCRVRKVTMIPHPQSVISMPMVPREIAESYRNDPEGTGWTLERMIAVGLANGKESSDDDKAMVAKWQAAWPKQGKPSWAEILFNGQVRAEETLAIIGEERLQQFATTLCKEWVLFGDKLKAALWWPHTPPRRHAGLGTRLVQVTI